MNENVNNLEALLALAAESQEESGIDMNEAINSERQMVPAGNYIAVLTEVIEYGNHAQEYNGKAKAPAMEFSLGFALYGEEIQDAPAIMRTFSMAMYQSDKANAFKIFKKLNTKGVAKSFAQLLGQAYVANVVHVKSPKTGKVNARLNFDGFLPPFDPMSKKPYPVPEVDPKFYRLFLWNKPTKEAWDSLYIEGVRDDGVSKNFIQEKIISALDYQGSALQLLLEGGDTGVHELPSELPKEAPHRPKMPPKPSIKPVVPAVMPVLPADDVSF